MSSCSPVFILIFACDNLFSASAIFSFASANLISPFLIFSLYFSFMEASLCSGCFFKMPSKFFLCFSIKFVYFFVYGSTFFVSLNVILPIMYTSESNASFVTTATPFSSPVPAFVLPMFVLAIISGVLINPTTLNLSLFIDFSPEIAGFSYMFRVSPIS